MEPTKIKLRRSDVFEAGPGDFNVTGRKQQHTYRESTKQHSLLWIVLALVLIASASPFAAAQAPPAFQHPGVLVSRAQLDFIKAQVNSHIDPIYTEFLNAQRSTYGTTSPYTPKGPPSGGVIDCGTASNPDNGCSAEDEDGSTAYTQALLYWITGNSAYAQNAITILNAYGHNLTAYTNSNAPLQAAWGSSKWARAAELIRHSNAGWSAADAQTFGNTMTNVMLPQIINGHAGNGNWELSMIEGMIGMAVYNDDPNLFNHAVTFWHERVPANFYYFPIDGPNPVPPPRGTLNWNGQTVFNNSVNGVSQETCRDFGHTEYSIAATMNAAETAHIQGVDLYGSEKPRLEATLEFHAFYLLGNPVPSSVCGGHVTLVSHPTFEIGYNNYHNRLGDSLPNTLQWLLKGVRTQSVEVDHHMMVFETLSHGADAGTAPQPDFSLTVTPSSQTISVGGDTSYTASVSPLNGFTGSVALTVSGLPSGATAGFNPSSISGGTGSSTLSITTNNTVAPGNYTLTITGTSGSTSHIATVMLSINAQPGFTLLANPNSLSVTVGGGANSTVSVGALNGFSGTVALSVSVSGAPAGITATLTPTSISTSGTSTLSVTTSSSAAAGSYTLTVTGSSGSLTHTINIALQVNPVRPPDFTVSASPASLTVNAGSSGSSTVSVGVVNGFSGAVALSVSGAPAGMTATLSPSSVNAPGSATLTVSAPSSAAASTSTLTITGTNGSTSHTATVSLTINPVNQCVSTTTNGPWQNAAFANQTGTFTAEYDATPSASPINAVIGLSNGAQTAYTGFAVITRFNPSGNIDARSGGSYTATSTIPYSGGVKYHFRVVVNIGTHTYAAYVTAPGQAEQTISANLAFRTEQATVSQLNWVGAFSEVGTETLCNFTLPDTADFALSATPSSQTVTAGGSTSYTVNVTPSGGFSGAVALSVSGMPAGVTAMLTPTSVSGSGTSTLSISTSSTTVAGTYTLSITGTSGSLTHSTSVTLTVNQQPDFSLSASPSSQTVTVGGSTSYTATVGALNGFSGSVALGVSGVPTGVTATLSPNSVSGSGSSTLSVSTSSSAVAGTYTLTITGTSGTLTHSANVTLQINPVQPPDFTVSASPTSLTVNAGSSGSSTVSVGVVNGFSGAVALSVSGAPAGVTATLSSSSVNAPGSAMLTVSAPSSAVASTSTLTITGTNGSTSHTATVNLTVNTASQCVSTTTNGPWQNAAFANQTGTFTAEYDVTPSASPINAVVGLSNGAQTAYTGFAVITRFNPSGNIDARSGGSYTATNTIHYTGGVKYHFRVVVNMTAHTYSAFVTAPGQAEQTIGTNLGFRTEQATVSQLNWVGAFSEVGTETLCNFTLPSAGGGGDFSLAPTPSSQTVTAGGSTSYTVNVTPSGGFSGAVALSVSGAPAGVTATLSPSSVTGSGSSTLNVSTTTGTAAGTYTLTITGTSGTLTHTASVSLVVQVTQAADFSLSASPNTVTATAGNAASYTASVSPVNGYTGTVTLSASGLPSGATASFSPASISGGSGSSTLTITTTSATTTGTVTVTITGTDSSAGLTHTATVSLTVNSSSSCAHGNGTLNPNVPPGCNFDMSIWSLQLPIGSPGNPTTISNTQLDNGFTDPYYFTGSDGAMNFFDPGVNCVTTANSTHCRSELREVNPDGSNAVWSASGTNTLSATLTVTQAAGAPVVGQIHDDPAVSVRPLIELFYTSSGDVVAGVEQCTAGSCINRTTVGHVPPGTKFSYVISYSQNKLTVSINGGAPVSLSSPILGIGGYFKAGDYGQSPTNASVSFYSLKVVHGP